MSDANTGGLHRLWKQSIFLYAQPAAITLFVCLAYVAAFCTKQTLKYLPGGSKRQRRFQIGYYVIAAIMIISPIAITVIRNFNIYRKPPFILETIGVVMFAIYWGLKSNELYESGIEKKAMVME